MIENVVHYNHKKEMGGFIMKFKKLLALVMVAVMTVGCLSACGGNDTQQSSNEGVQEQQNQENEAQGSTEQEDVASAETGETVTTGGKIMWLSNLSSGAQYEASLAYAEYVCGELGYELEVVYGDAFNDPAGNLSAVKNAMTDDVVGIIASQDGGIINIMEEYPEVFVAGYNTDMAAVYGEGGASAAAVTNDHFLGTIADGFVSGADDGKRYAEVVIANGYKRVSTMIFPAYAYPQAAIGDAAFREAIAEYNETAEEPIEIVGDAEVLEFAPLEESYFLEEGHGDLDCVVAMCAGVSFVYPALMSAKASGTCSADTKMVTAGYEEDSSIQADTGGEGTIQYIHVSATENIAYAICLLDTAISGTMYADYTASEAIDGLLYEIDSAEDQENTTVKSVLGTKNPADSPLTMDEIKEVLPRFNSEATYAGLKELFASEQLTADYLAQ